MANIKDDYTTASGDVNKNTYQYDKKRLGKQLRVHEGYRKMPYKDSKGIDTVGIGRNLRDVGIPEWSGTSRDVYKTGVTEEEAEAFALNDSKLMESALEKKLPYFKTLNGVRQRVLIDMAFNMGVRKLGQFVSMFDGLGKRDFNKAADNMLFNFNKKTGKKTGKTGYSKDVGKRATRLSNMMRTGRDSPIFSGLKQAKI